MSLTPARLGWTVRRLTTARLPTRAGVFTAISYDDGSGREPPLALILGQLRAPALVRLHSECLTGAVFGSLRCDCGPQLALAMDAIGATGTGVIVYLRQEGRGIGLSNKLAAYALQDEGKDTVEANEALGFPADLREYGVAAGILQDLGLRSVRLLTNNPRKVAGLEEHGIEVVERVPLETQPTSLNGRYLAAKRAKLGHLLGSLAGDEPLGA